MESITEEHVLSQKMSQLSTNTTDTKEWSLLKEIKVEIDKVPGYLTKRNILFNQMSGQILPQMELEMTVDDEQPSTINNINRLRKIAILIYKILIIQTYQLLWAAYLKSGIGQLIIPSQTKLPYNTTLPIWPKEIKTMLLANNVEHMNKNETYFNFVTDQLHGLDSYLKQFQTELNVKANNLKGFTLTSQNIIQAYIGKNLQIFRMEIEHKIELVYYDYHIRALKLEYYQLNPNPFQKQLMIDICQSEYERETAEQELNFLQQQITYSNSSSQSFEYSLIAHDPLIDSIENLDTRQHLYQQYKQVAEQARANLFTFYMKTAKEQRDEYKNKHESNLQKMWNAYRSTSSDNEKISTSMLDLIHQRCMKINERIKCVYKFKALSIRLEF
ncbi:unnamed protein product [Adineta ricciae]|uniref:Uncharacterized protein n=1 Tax=Adineta ricciae TaxID=249248 RepID=A0A815D4X6_ADIRI|nr:unnamed protein product [Adineta ricciae]CAF1532311.1 unnamed protein product [Adineta ricciae]